MPDPNGISRHELVLRIGATLSWSGLIAPSIGQTNALRRSPTATSEDRRIRFGDGRAQRQRMAAIDGMRYEDTVPFINSSSSPAGGIAGTVDMRACLKRLDDHGYGVGITVH